MHASDDVAADRIGSRFSLWMLRPYLDLGPAEIGPLHVESIEQGWRAVADESEPRFLPQRAMPPGFRSQLGQEAGPPYLLNDPRELPAHLRTQRWNVLCDWLDHWEDLPGERQCRLASLLHSMCLYRTLLKLIPEAKSGAGPNGETAVELMFWRASAGFMNKQMRRASSYQPEDMVRFLWIAQNAPDVVPVGFNAITKVFVHKAKTGAPVAELVEWGSLLEKALSVAAARMDEFELQLYTSRFYRSMGFIPQRGGDSREVISVMDRAELHARKMIPATKAQDVLYRENMHALLESRTKEALWLGDKDLALSRALALVEFDPFDSKAWSELGQVRYLRQQWQEASEAYAVAALLGPPASAVGRYMVGACLQQLGFASIPALFFKDVLEIDPLGVSPHLGIRNLPSMEVLRALRVWSDNMTEA